MVSKKPNPFKIDKETAPLTDKELAKARPGKEVLAELGIMAPRGRPFLPEGERKKRVTIMLDQDVIEYFKKDGSGWQTRANAALRRAVGLE